jgi:hypothetical protein
MEARNDAGVEYGPEGAGKSHDHRVFYTQQLNNILLQSPLPVPSESLKSLTLS